jgi:hypothetical protein
MHEAERASHARIQRDSGKHISNARESVSQSNEHVRESKSAIQRSLRLLRNVPPND